MAELGFATATFSPNGFGFITDPTVSGPFNLTIGPATLGGSVINVTNTGRNGANLNDPGFGVAVGNI